MVRGLKRSALSFCLASAFFMLSPGITFCDQGESPEKVISTGLGIDIERARQNAFRSALEQLIGMYVPSEAILKEGTLLKKEILSNGSDFIGNSRMVQQEKNEEGLSLVKIESEIATSSLIRKLQSLGIPLKSTFSGKGRTGSEWKSGEAISQLLSRYPQRAYSYFVGSPEIESTNTETGRVKTQIPITIKWDNDFLNSMMDILGQTSQRELNGVEIASFREGENRNIAKEGRVICLNQKHPNRSGKADQCFSFPSQNLKSPGDATGITGSGWPATFLDLLGTKKIITVSMYFKDKSGKLVESVNYEFVSKEGEKKAKKKGKEKASSNLRLLLRTGSFDPPNINWRDPDSNVIYILRDEAFTLNANVEMDARSVKDIVNIEVSMSNVSADQ